MENETGLNKERKIGSDGRESGSDGLLILVYTVMDTEIDDKKLWKPTRTRRQELTRAWINKMSTQTTPREVS